MTQKYYADSTTGDYLGSYDGDAGDNPFSGETDTGVKPNAGTDNWNGSSWDAAAAYVTDVEDIRSECRRRMEIDGHDLAAKKATPPAASTTYLDDLVTDCETLEGTLPTGWTDNSHWTAAP